MTNSSLHPYYLRGSILLYSIKKNEIFLNNYIKAQPYLLIGMINVIKKHIHYMIFGNKSQNEIIFSIQTLFSEECYNDIFRFYMENPSDDAFIKAFISKDSVMMHDIIKSMYKKNIIKNKFHKLKRILYSCIRKI